MIFSSKSLFVLYINLPQLSILFNSNCLVSPPAGLLFLPHHPLSGARPFEGLLFFFVGSSTLMAAVSLWEKAEHSACVVQVTQAEPFSLCWGPWTKPHVQLRGRKDPAQPFSCLLAPSESGSSGALTENLHPPSPGDPSELKVPSHPVSH